MKYRTALLILSTPVFAVLLVMPSLFWEKDRLHIALASCLERQNKLAEAETEYEAAVQWDPFVASNYAELGDFFMRHKRAKDAVAEYKEVVRLEPKETKYQDKLAEATKAQGK